MYKMLIISPKYENLKGWLMRMPEIFDTEGTLIYSARNVLKSFDIDDNHIVVKRFRQLDILKGIIYTFFRESKAERSYNNSIELVQRGIGTPTPIAFIEKKKWGLVSETYYICEHTNYAEIATELNEKDTFNESLAKAYAAFAAKLHSLGILHYDLNSGNVLYKKDDTDTYSFQLIDVNRMKFMPSGTPVPIEDCMENLTLFTGNMKLHAVVVREYAKYRGLAETFVKKATAVKLRHDRRWRRRKALTHPIRTIKRLTNNSC